MPDPSDHDASRAAHGRSAPDGPARPPRPARVAQEPGDFVFGGAKTIIEQEIAHLRAWRGQAGKSDADILGAGIALSGGGIRAASFCLGVLQALAFFKWLPRFNYLSSVSGGGYIGASLTYLLHRKWRGRCDCGGRGHCRGCREEAVQFGTNAQDFPYASFPIVDTPPPPHERLLMGRLLRMLRQNAKYLTPGAQITMLSLLGVVARNTAASLIAYVSLAVLLFHGLELSGFLLLDPETVRAAASWKDIAPIGLLSIAQALGLSYLVFSVIYVVTTQLFDWFGLEMAQRGYRIRRDYEKTTHFIFLTSIIVLVVCSVPYLHYFNSLAWQLLRTKYVPTLLHEASDSAPPALFGAISSVIGVISGIFAWFRARQQDLGGRFLGLLIAVASTTLLVGLLLIAYWATDTRAVPLWYPLTGFVLFGLVADIHYISLYRYYRDRLMETFMPDMKNVIEREDLAAGASPEAEATMLGAVCAAHEDPRNPAPKGEYAGPYHLLNANVVLVGSETPRYRGRGGDNFILSPLYVGSNATGWKASDPSTKSGMTLATAMAVSGAAVNPNAAVGGDGITRQPVLAAVMTLLNLRLGYWLRTPGCPDAASARKPPARWSSWLRPNFIWPGIAELFGRLLLRETASYVLLTDGGHFENLGLYELVRRRLKVIVVCDGAEDANYTFSDLANAIEKVRADFGAIVDVSADELRALTPGAADAPPKGAAGTKAGAAAASSTAAAFAERGYLVATIRYAPTEAAAAEDAAADAAPAHAPPAHAAPAANAFGLLIYLRATLVKGLSADLFGFANEHPQFPNEPTTNQFFNEKQFECYRELGFTIARTALYALRPGSAAASPGADAEIFTWDGVAKDAHDGFDALGFPAVVPYLRTPPSPAP